MREVVFELSAADMDKSLVVQDTWGVNSVASMGRSESQATWLEPLEESYHDHQHIHATPHTRTYSAHSMV